MTYREWLNRIPKEMTADPLWTIEAYRLAMFAADVGWADATKLMQDKRTLDLSGQLYEAVGSIGANISEGFSRQSGRDRARFYEYALGSARESRTWYFNARHILTDLVATHRIQLLTQIIRLLMVMVPDQRRNELREGELSYTAAGSLPWTESPPANSLDQLLENVPL